MLSDPLKVLIPLLQLAVFVISQVIPHAEEIRWIVFGNAGIIKLFTVKFLGDDETRRGCANVVIWLILTIAADGLFIKSLRGPKRKCRNKSFQLVNALYHLLGCIIPLLLFDCRYKAMVHLISDYIQLL